MPVPQWAACARGRRRAWTLAPRAGGHGRTRECGGVAARRTAAAEADGAADARRHTRDGCGGVRCCMRVTARRRAAGGAARSRFVGRRRRRAPVRARSCACVEGAWRRQARVSKSAPTKRAPLAAARSRGTPAPGGCVCGRVRGRCPLCSVSGHTAAWQPAGLWVTRMHATCCHACNAGPTFTRRPRPGTPPPGAAAAPGGASGRARSRSDALSALLGLMLVCSHRDDGVRTLVCLWLYTSEWP